MATEEWERYPANWSRDAELEFDAADSLRRLEDPEGIYFLEEDDDDINVRITDVNDGRYPGLDVYVSVHIS